MLTEEKDIESSFSKDLDWVRKRENEINVSGCRAAFDENACSCEEPQSATEFFLIYPLNEGCECECESC